MFDCKFFVPPDKAKNMLYIYLRGAYKDIGIYSVFWVLLILLQQNLLNAPAE